jgi:hypothetical protein
MRWLALLLVAACYSPHPQSGAKCAADNTCPEGLACVVTPQGSVCAPPGTVFPDAATVMPDAREIDAPRAADARVWMDAPAVTGPMLEQQATGEVQSGTTVDATFSTTPASGDLLVMVGAANGGPLDGVTGGAASWTQAAFSVDNSNIEIWYGYADGSGSTVTITRAANFNNLWIQVSEWSGMVATAPLDLANANSGLNNTASPLSLTTAHAHDIIIFGVASGKPATIGAPSPGTWTAMNSVQTLDNLQTEWFAEVSATGTYQPAVSDSTADGWDAAIAAFKAAN